MLKNGASRAALAPQVALAGITVATMGLAQVLAIGALVVAPFGSAALPAGIVATFLGATVGGAVAWLLHRQPGEVTGPRVTIGVLFSALVADLLGRHGGSFQDLAPALAVAVVLTGLLQLLAGRFHLDEALKFLPHPVIAGFITGTGMLVIWAQLGPLMGLQGRISGYDWDRFLGMWKPLALTVGIFTIAAIWLLPRLTRRIQPTLGGLALGTAAYHLVAHSAATGSVGPVIGPIAMPLADFGYLQRLWGGLSVSWLVHTTREVLPYAALLALQASMDSTLTARAVAELTGKRANARRTLISQGVANVVSGCIGGIPVGISAVQSLVAARTGPAVRFAPPAAALALLLMFMLLGPVVAQIPLVVLAGALLTIGVGLIDRWARTLFAQVVRGGDAQHELKWNLLVVVAVAGALFFGNVPMSLAVGTMLAMILLARSISNSTTFDAAEGRMLASTRHWTLQEEVLLGKMRSSIVAFRLRGGVFFGTADQLAARLESLDAGVRYCIVDCSPVTVFDATGCHIIARSASKLMSRDVRLLLAGLDPANPHDAALRDLGLGTAVPKERWFPDMDHALEWVEARLLQERLPSVRHEAEVPLRATLLARGLSGSEFVELESRVTMLEHDAGKRLFQLGDRGLAMFAIARGLVEIRVPRSSSKSGSRRLAVFGPGAVFGETAVLSRGTRSADAICVAQVRLYALAADALDDLERSAPAVFSKILANLNQHLAVRLRRTTEIARE